MTEGSRSPETRATFLPLPAPPGPRLPPASAASLQSLPRPPRLLPESRLPRGCLSVQIPRVLKGHRAGLSVKVKVLVAPSCPPLCGPMDGSPPGSSVHWILQARGLDWVAISFSMGFSQARDRTRLCHTAGGLFTH